MKTLRYILAMGFILGCLCSLDVPSEARSRAIVTTSGGGVLTGELVIVNAAQNRFRLVGHSGTFTAPPGTPVEAFDGKPVEVELSRNGRVLQISEMPIERRPIAHSMEVVSGQLVVRDPVQRAFTIAGDNRLYVAPASLDVGLYDRRLVEVRLDEQGRVIDLSPVTRSGDAPVTSVCSYNGQTYRDGVSLCQSGTQFLCERGLWRNIGTACVAPGSSLAPSPRECIIGDASVSSGSSICRRGTTFRCRDGEWMNIGTACS